MALQRIVAAATKVFAYIAGLVFTIIFGIQLLLRALARPSICKRQREVPYPPQLSDNQWGEHKYIVANGIKFHYVENGAKSAPLMLCLHGFPECWYSWRYFLKSYASTHHVVAVDMRGYGETLHTEPSWWNASDYSMRKLVADVRHLIEAFGANKCTLVAHDWGGMVAWSFAYAHQNMLDNLIILNAPHPLAFQDTMSFAQFLRSNYVFVFQYPLAPEIWLSADNYAFLREVFLGEAMGVRRKNDPLALKESDVDVYRYIFSRAGVPSAAANYYRNIFGDNVTFQREIGVRRSNKLDVPLLLIWGEEDGALGKTSPHHVHKYCTNLTLHMIPNASHWVQQDAVQEVLDTVGTFLRISRSPIDVQGRQRRDKEL